MATNLVEMLLSALTPRLTSSLGKAAGGSDSLVSSALVTLVPVLLGGMASKVSTSEGAGELFSMLTGSNVDPNIASTIEVLLGSGQTSSLMDVGAKLLGGLFGGERAGALGPALGEASGLSGGSAKSLALMVAPLVFGMIKKFIAGGGLDAESFANLLRDQARYLAGRLDPRLTAALGLGSPAALLSGFGAKVGAGVAGADAAVQGAATGNAAAATAGASGFARWLPWIIGVAVLALLASQLGNCSGAAPKVDAPAAPAAPASAPALAPTVAAAAAADATLDLPQSGDMVGVVYFDSGKSELPADAAKAIADAIAAVNADSGKKLMLSGFHDATGDPVMNAELARNRAKAVFEALTARGVAAERILLRKPVQTSPGGPSAEARRVEIRLVKTP